jgi:aminoglycoside/choline kinase family phosphotransferase
MQLEILKKLFLDVCGEPVVAVHPINETVSSRRKIRLLGEHHRAIGVYSPNPKETQAFIRIGKHLAASGVAVPKVLAQNSDDPSYYIEEDLGETTLYKLVTKEIKTNGSISAQALNLIKSALSDLVKIQFNAVSNFPFDACFPRSEYDEQSLKWDLDYFKYHFLLLANIEIDEDALARDMSSLVNLVPKNCPSIMHRDFQGRNIMVGPNQKLYYIDFQGARRGPAEYDVASIVYQRGTGLTEIERAELIDGYYDVAKKHLGYSRDEYLSRLQLMRLFRNLQVLGTRGRRGLFQGQTALIASIPEAINEVEAALTTVKGLAQLPELNRLLPEMKGKFQKHTTEAHPLCVKVSSFSYRSSIPRDHSEHGGGYVFDCRSLSNPHEIKEIRDFNGTQPEIKSHLSKDPVVSQFETDLRSIVGGSVERYLSKGYDSLSVDFGCTGGKHRSVYMAEALGLWLRKQFADRNIKVEILHRELGIQS